ncbi:MAG: hypothetical protein ABI183_04665 [Polyangiaceae bacterium]
MRSETTSAEPTYRLRPVVAEPYRAGAGALKDRHAEPPRSLDEIEAVLKTSRARRSVFPPNRRERVGFAVNTLTVFQPQSLPASAGGPRLTLVDFKGQHA